jgi:NADH dehydrogenase FAD-containing subunit
VTQLIATEADGMGESIRSAPRRPSVAVVGGGYGGIVVASGLDDIADVVLVEPKDAFVHNVASLRALVDPSWLPRIFLPYDHLLTNGRVFRDRAVQVDAGRVLLASGGELAADYIVLATGSTYPFPAKSDVNDTEVAYERYRATNAELAASERVLLLGAGAVGIELAGEVKAVWPEKQVTIVDIADDVLGPRFMPELRAELRRQLEELGVVLILGSPLRDPPSTAPGVHGTFSVTTEDGRVMTADLWFRCYGLRPVTDYLSGSLATARLASGEVEVTPELRVAGHDAVFAIGDMTALDSKGAGVAGRQAELVCRNLRALITGEGPQESYTSRGPAIVVPIGPEGGAGQLPGQAGIADRAFVAAAKGRDMMVDRFRVKLGLTAASPRV